MTIANDNDSIFICVIPYQGRHPEELSMKKGEIIEGFQLTVILISDNKTKTNPLIC
jgi:hypothetical protein